jgi:hypothetical protein
LQGPIGVDNSEVINIEMEKELKKRAKNIAHTNSNDDPDEYMN